MRLARALGILAMLLAVSAARADTITDFTFPTVTGADNSGLPYQPGFAGYDPTTVASGAQVTGIMPGSGLTGTVAIELFNYTSPVLRIDALGSTTTLSSSVAANRYFDFTVTPEQGSTLSLESLSFQTARGGGSTPRGFGVFSSETGTAIGDELFALDIPTTRPTLTDSMIDLTAAEFQGLSGPISFRFNVFAPGGGQTLEFDNIVLAGTVTAIPEPASVALLALLGSVAAAGAVVCHRRRRHCR